MAENYTPDTTEVRDVWAGHGKGYGNAGIYDRQAAQFDRWLDTIKTESGEASSAP